MRRCVLVTGVFAGLVAGVAGGCSGTGASTPPQDASADAVGDASPVADPDAHLSGPDASPLDSGPRGFPACAPYDANHSPSVDPSTVCAIDCTSANAMANMMLHIEPVQAHGTTFIAQIAQATPTSFYLAFTNTTASWSGNFFNFEDTTSQLQSQPPWKFHALVGFANSPSNAEVYLVDSNDGPVNVAPIACQIRGY